MPLVPANTVGDGGMNGGGDGVSGRGPSGSDGVAAAGALAGGTGATVTGTGAGAAPAPHAGTPKRTASPRARAHERSPEREDRRFIVWLPSWGRWSRRQ